MYNLSEYCFYFTDTFYLFTYQWERLHNVTANRKEQTNKLLITMSILQSQRTKKSFFTKILSSGTRKAILEAYRHVRRQKKLLSINNTFKYKNLNLRLNLRLIGTCLHMGEVSLHLHIDYVSVIYRYSNGLLVRNSLDEVMKILLDNRLKYLR